MLKFIKEGKVMMVTEDNGELKIIDEDLKDSFKSKEEDKDDEDKG